MPPSHSDDLESLLAELISVDDRLRAVYRALAHDPDAAEDQESVIRDLQSARRSLAQRLGLAMLAQRRAPAIVAAAEPADDRAGDEPATSVEIPASEPSAPEVAPVSVEVIDEWKRSASTSGVGRTAYEDRIPVTWVTTLDKLMSRVGPPRDLDIDLDDELVALDAIGRDPFVDQWATLPRHVQQSWLGMLVARTRAAKEVSGLSASQRARIKTVISRYPAWAGEYHPGHVHGLRVDHAPIDGSWRGDAGRLWAALDTLIDVERPVSKTSAPKKRRAVPDEVDEAVVRAIDPAWPIWPLVRGQRALMVGGDPREENRRRLEQQFELATLDWPDIAGPRRVEAIVSRIKRRSVDLVLLLTGFIDHKQSEPIIAAAKEAGVRWSLSDGYGAASIRAGLERFLGDRTGT